MNIISRTTNKRFCTTADSISWQQDCCCTSLLLPLWTSVSTRIPAAAAAAVLGDAQLFRATDATSSSRTSCYSWVDAKMGVSCAIRRGAHSVDSTHVLQWPSSIMQTESATDFALTLLSIPLMCCRTMSHSAMPAILCVLSALVPPVPARNASHLAEISPTGSTIPVCLPVPMGISNSFRGISVCVPLLTFIKYSMSTDIHSTVWLVQCNALIVSETPTCNALPVTPTTS